MSPEPILVWHDATVNRKRCSQQNGHKSVVLWFTGLSCSWKSTLTNAVEDRLNELWCRTFVFDGDNVRHGLCSNLGFSDADRRENIRHIRETAKLMLESGAIVMTTFISHFQAARKDKRLSFPQVFQKVVLLKKWRMMHPIEKQQQGDMSKCFRSLLMFNFC